MGSRPSQSVPAISRMAGLAEGHFCVPSGCGSMARQWPATPKELDERPDGLRLGPRRFPAPPENCGAPA